MLQQWGSRSVCARVCLCVHTKVSVGSNGHCGHVREAVEGSEGGREK